MAVKKETPEEKAAREKEAKWQAIYFHLWTLSCQTPRAYWGLPEEAQFLRARDLTGLSLNGTNWLQIRDVIREDCPVVFEAAIELAKTSLGITTEGK